MSNGSVVETSDIVVKPVATAAQQRHFIRFPWSIYRDNCAWVPPLISDFKKKLDVDCNPFYQHANIQTFLAYHNGTVVGTIAAIVDHEYNRFHGENAGFFGFFEAVDLVVVARALMNSVKVWMKERGITFIRGPVNPSTADSMGTLLDSHDLPPAILMSYNPSYYPRLLEETGLKKGKDLLALYMDALENPVPARVSRLCEVVQRRHNVTVRSGNINKMDQDMALLKEIYNDAWNRNWGFVPWTDAEVDFAARDLKSVIDPDLVIFAFVDGEPAGFSLALPDFHQVLRHMNGRLLPTGIVKALWYRRKIDMLRVVLAGIRHKFRNLALDAIFYHETYHRGLAKGFRRGEFSWILEDNYSMLNTLQNMGARIYKKYRIYETEL